MSRRGEFDWRRHKRNWDYQKCGGRLDPDEDDVFFGPVTVRELKKMVELEEAIVMKKTKEKKKAMLEVPKSNVENEDVSELNRTFEIDENSGNPTLTHTLNTTFGDDTLSKSTKKSINRSQISGMREPLKDISSTNTGIPVLENLELDEVSHNFSNISMNSVKNTSMNKKNCLIDETFPEFVHTHLPTPLIDKMPKSVTKTPTKRDSSRLDNSVLRTPRVTKMSDTFITDMLAEDVLLDSSLPGENTSQNASDKRPSTPQVFKRKNSELWKKDVSNLRKSIVDNSLKSKLPKVKKTPEKTRHFFPKSPGTANSSCTSKLPRVKKTPAKDKFFFLNSPVADYINLGVNIQSLSKLRHSHCIKPELEEKSKSDNKASKPCSKIPQPTFGAAKRKLNLETKSVIPTSSVQK